MHRPRKRFGQHFLHDPAIIDRIVAAVDPQPGQALVEIGPGHGALTFPLLERARCLDVVELDRDLAATLRQRATAFDTELRVHEADALTFDFCALAPEQTSLRVVGNLPYNISTPLLFHLLKQKSCISDMHFMLQKEVANRIAAQPGTRDYGRLSVMVQFFCQVTPLFRVGPGAFKPAPRVESAVLRLKPLIQTAVPVRDEAGFARLVTRAFSQRRKTLRNALRGVVSAEAMGAVGIDPGLRPERLSVEQFALLSDQTLENP